MLRKNEQQSSGNENPAGNLAGQTAGNTQAATYLRQTLGMSYADAVTRLRENGYTLADAMKAVNAADKAARNV